MALALSRAAVTELRTRRSKPSRRSNGVNMPVRMSRSRSVSTSVDWLSAISNPSSSINVTGGGSAAAAATASCASASSPSDPCRICSTLARACPNNA
jgi:hypothetical protein